MFAEDSFFTLTFWGGAGLLALSLTLAAAMIWIVSRFYGYWGTRVLLALFLWYAFLWLSPQIYYQYYRLIFEGLPQQSVIQRHPDHHDIIWTLTFQAGATLSAYSQGILGWAMIAAAAIRRKP